jgi:CRP-like cAMP-binding protein
MTKKDAREVSFHCYLTKLMENQDLMNPGDACKALYMVMSGVIGVFVRMASGEEFFTDMLGVGSIIG